MPAPMPVAPERITVLVADDEVAVPEMIADATEFGYAVLEAEDDLALSKSCDQPCRLTCW